MASSSMPSGSRCLPGPTRIISRSIYVVIGAARRTEARKGVPARRSIDAAMDWR
jgi:hypothetical protein